MSDLIFLYANRAKFHQHFMSIYDTSLQSCLDSILKVLEHAMELSELITKKFGKSMFQQIFPFFYTFLYQTFVVIYTLLHLNFPQLAPHYNELGNMRHKLKKLFDVVGVENWRPNVVKIIEAINGMCDKFFSMILEQENAGVLIEQAPSKSVTGSTTTVHFASAATTQLPRQVPGDRMLPPQQATSSGAIADDVANASSPLSFNPSVKVENVPEEISNNIQSLTSSSNANVIIGPQMPTQSSSTNSTQHPQQPQQQRSLSHFYAGASSMSLSQISLAANNFTNQMPGVDIFNTPQQLGVASNDNNNNGNIGTNTNTNANMTNFGISEPSPLGFINLSDPFYVQNPFNFTYPSGIGFASVPNDAHDRANATGNSGPPSNGSGAVEEESPPIEVIMNHFDHHFGQRSNSTDSTIDQQVQKQQTSSQKQQQQQQQQQQVQQDGIPSYNMKFWD
ncbi:unnamed protein product [Ambrosiozyma monospora]|uniref:Unnamed protein product n=1 Tax=Ambrosiozyma monospora TaxID=43982 RepID=A0ACB5T540_AMBMO|nr:unnamed protein product [Ambrosiozyma monospora]